MGFTMDPVEDVFLYLRPQEFSRKEYDKYAVFFKTVFPQVSEKITFGQGYRSIRIASLVYGKDEDFVLQNRMVKRLEETQIIAGAIMISLMIKNEVNPGFIF